jgi:hypothetical protein
MNKWANELRRQFSKENDQKYMKKCSKFRAINEMQINMTLIFLHTAVRMAIIKKRNNNMYLQGSR